ncbi:acyltransferase [Paenibacillus sp.]|uniref:acyltransferase family protein n=1 Tax=Paenibacillus sp. TaxID=58172 RepID=UPI002D72137A|nr:acyltransferase [Paenibacillus sp.]HZG84915.1 acyltransferase [Paenibacillus sp.]
MQNKLEFIDSLRGFAILIVIMIHVAQNVPDFPYFPLRGVTLFYLVSAFTLFLSLYRREGKGESLSSFYLRRFFRIAPLYYLALIVYLLVNGLGPRYWLGDQENVTLLNILSHITFINGFNPYWINSIIGVEWSIAIEMTFYAFVPLLYAKIKNVRQSIIFVILSMIVCYGLGTILSKFSPIGSEQLWKNYLYLWLPNQLPVFALGILLFFLWKRDNENKTPTKTQRILIFSLVAFVSLVLAYLGNKTTIVAVTFLVFSYVLSKRKLILFVNKFWSSIGKISYSMYLVHFLVIEQIVALGVGNQMEVHLRFILLYTLTIAITVAISMVTYRYVEQPSIDWSRKIGHKYQRKTKVLPGDSVAKA